MGDHTQFVTVVNPTDVLFGRGSGPNDHEGNIRFRDVVSKRKAEYMSTNHRQTKATIAKDVVNTVYQSNGRFLKKLEASDLQKMGFPPSTEVYQIVDDDTVMEKAKQALRQNRDKNASQKRSISPKPRKHHQMAAPASLLNTAEFNMKNFAQGLASHEMLEPVPLPGGMGNAPTVAEHARPQQNPGFNKYAQQLEGLAATNQAIARRMSSRRESLQLSEIMYSKDLDGMSGLMESFKGMSTTGENLSQDSIGTIDNMFGDPQHEVSGISNMSLGSVFTEQKSERSGSRRPAGRMSISSRSGREALGETADWVFDEQSPSGAEGGGSLWPLEESRNSGTGAGLMLPPANRPVNQQAAASLMNEPLQDSSVMMSTGDIGMSTGSLMMTSIDSLGPLEERK